MPIYIEAVTPLTCGPLGMRSKEGRFSPARGSQINLMVLNSTQPGVNRPSLLRILSFVFAVFIFWAPAHSQSLAPQILKIDPPSWWSRSSANPIRLLIRGTNLKSAQVQIAGADVHVVGAPKVNDRGTYVFADVSIAPNAKPGKRELSLRTPTGVGRASFEVLSALNRQDRFQGFSPSDVLYLIMID